VLSIGLVLAGAVYLRAATPPADNPPPAASHHPNFDQYSVWQTWKLYCVECHIGPKAPAGLNLQALDLTNLDDNGATWEKPLRKLRYREMPPDPVRHQDSAIALG
jgi:hypothetical protein